MSDAFPSVKKEKNLKLRLVPTVRSAVWAPAWAGPGEVWPSQAAPRAQQSSSKAAPRGDPEDPPCSGALGFASQEALQPNSTGSFWWAPGAQSGPTSRNQSAEPRTEPKLLSSTAREDDQDSPKTPSVNWITSRHTPSPAQDLLPDPPLPPAKAFHSRCNTDF